MAFLRSLQSCCEVFDLARFGYEAFQWDRIRGIMHAYGVNAANLIEHATNGLHDARAIADLEYRFSCTLLQRNPVLSELTIHSLTSDEKESWRMNKSCIVPDFDIFIDYSWSHISTCSCTASSKVRPRLALLEQLASSEA